MRTIIFGCGVLGKQVFQVLGKENVDFFCDNNEKLVGRELFGIQIIPYEKVKAIFSSEETLLILGVNGYNAEMIAEQLEADSIYEFVLAKYVISMSRDKVFDIKQLYDKHARHVFVEQYLRERLRNQKKQTQYLKKHCDISYMSPADGILRDKQLQSIRNVKEILAFLQDNCPIKCWITSGTLIGEMRHRGKFIPWDDDIDFGVMRGDIYRLMKFFSSYSIVYVYGEDKNYSYIKKYGISNYKYIGDIPETYDGRYFLQVADDYVRILRRIEGEIEIALELFPFDYYNENLTIEQYQQFTSDSFLKKKSIDNGKEWFEYCFNKIENSGVVSMTPSSKILPGIDSFIYRGLWNIEDFIPYDVVFPLKRVDFEGLDVLCVNNEERYMQHEYPDWKNFPKKIPVDKEGE